MSVQAIAELYINGENIALILFFIGVYGLTAYSNVLKSIISLGIMQAAIILFFVSINASTKNVPPIGSSFGVMPADPIPQALMITAVVIGMSITAVSLTMYISLVHKYGSVDWDKVRLKREEIE